MSPVAGHLDEMSLALVPSLSRSLAEQFNVFRVMHHGTHEKQLSNVFAWLLRPDGTHGLGSSFQRIFVEQVNESLSAENRLPTSGYRVVQEVDTSGPDALGRDIADIVLSSPTSSIVIENFESSDGHGHDFARYLAHGAAGDRQSVVVLLCARFEPNRQTNGWQHAVVVTYEAVLKKLEEFIAANKSWQRTHPRQIAFISQLVDHFLEGAGPVDTEDGLAFIKVMCDTGESARYGFRPQQVAADEFANLMAQHAKRQFEDGRRTLGEVKRSLKRYAERVLVMQVDAALASNEATSVNARYAGQWEWCVALRRPGLATLHLAFGPTAVVENVRAPEPLDHPDYSRVFVTRAVVNGSGIDRIVQSDVSLDEVLTGLADSDVRLRDAVLALARLD